VARSDRVGVFAKFWRKPLTLAEQGRVRIISDNASLHVTKKTAKVKTPEGQFADLFRQRKMDPSPIVHRSYCGSSNLTSGGEAANGDNLIAIRDADEATAFAIEALGLIDHDSFLDRMMNAKKAVPKKKAATTAGAEKVRTKRKTAGAKNR
jgi:hypothetical protein